MTVRGLGLAACLAICLVWPPAAPSLAQGPGETGEQLRQRLSQALDQQEDLLFSRQRLQDELERLEAEQAQAQEQTRELQAQQKNLASRLPLVLSQIQELTPQVQAQGARYKKQLRALYFLAADDGLAFLASAQDFHDALTRAHALARLLGRQQAAYLELRAQQANLAELKSLHALRQNELAELGRQLEERRDALARMREARQLLLAEQGARQEALAENIAALSEAQARLARTFALQSQPPAGARAGISGARGRLSPPVDGQLLETPDEGRPGALIQARPGASVRAPWAGQVAHAGELAGFKLVVILDHGERVHTVMAGLGTLAVEQGQTLAPGEALGTLDQEGRLYLEVRKGTRPQNPLDWMRLNP